MSKQGRPFYLIFKNDGSGEFLMFRTTEGKIALSVFKSRESAQAYIDGKRLSDKLKVEEYTQDAAVEWMRNAVKRYGASELAVDPDPVTSDVDTGVIPILIFLIEVEGQSSG